MALKKSWEAGAAGAAAGTEACLITASRVGIVTGYAGPITSGAERWTRQKPPKITAEVAKPEKNIKIVFLPKKPSNGKKERRS